MRFKIRLFSHRHLSHDEKLTILSILGNKPTAEGLQAMSKQYGVHPGTINNWIRKGLADNQDLEHMEKIVEQCQTELDTILTNTKKLCQILAAHQVTLQLYHI